jgi:hypothetical protein
MKSFLKIGAAIALALLAAPIVVAESRNHVLVTPLWVVISYVVASRLLPARSRALAVPASIICGQLAWQLLYILSLGVDRWQVVATAALAATLGWLLLRGSRLAAGATIAAELAALGLAAPGLPALFEQIVAQGLATFVPGIVALYLCPAAAIGVLGPITAQDHQRDAKVARVFD